MVSKVGYARGRCPVCGRILIRLRPAEIAVCDCWEYCSLENWAKKMEPYTSDLTPSTYRAGEIDVVMWHNSPSDHKDPYCSKRKPVEVKLS